MADSNIEYFGKTDLLYLVNLIHTEIIKYVKAIEGKGLSSNDFTDDLKDKLNNIDLSNYATLLSPNFTGTPTAPTAAVGTDSTQIATTAFTVAAIADAIKDVTGISFDGPYESYENMVETVTNPKNGVIYLVTIGTTGTNVNEEYYWNGTKFELFGTTSIDLSGYLKKADVVEMTETEVKAVWDSVFTA